MMSTARIIISALPRGYEFPRASFAVDAERVRAYLTAVGDRNDYGGTVPPLALTALGLNALQEQISLPEGSLHTGQEVEHTDSARAGEAFTLTGRIAQRSERHGFVISVIEFEVATAAAVAIRARTTIMVPATAS